jgi:hypothetical protein
VINGQDKADFIADVATRFQEALAAGAWTRPVPVRSA